MPLPIVESTRPVESLPVELLVHILLLVFWDEPDRHFSKSNLELEGPDIEDLYQLRLVCRAWNAVIEATPAFWSVIDNKAPPSWIRLCVERSRGAPLHVYYENNTYAMNPTYITTLATTASRWETLRVNVEEGADESVPAVIQIPRCPQLKSLSIHFFNPPNWKTTILAGGAPLLRNLHIQAETLDPRWVAFSGLTRLESLSIGLYGEFDYDTEETYLPVSTQNSVLDALQCVRGTLRQFFLGVDSSDNTPPPTGIPREPITLPELRVLEGTKLTQPLVQALLLPLRLPALRTVFLEICTNSESASDAALIEMLAAFLRSSRGLDVRLKPQTRDGDDDVIRIAVLDPELDIVIHLKGRWGDEWNPFLERLCGAGPAAHLPMVGPDAELVVHLVIGFNNLTTKEAVVYEGFERWLRPQVTTLELCMPSTSESDGHLAAAVVARFRSAASRILGEIQYFKNLRAVVLPRAEERDAVRDAFTEALLKPFSIELKYPDCTAHLPLDPSL